MKLFALGLLVFLTAFPDYVAPLCAASHRTELAPVPRQFTGKVARVYDGDTIQVRYRDLLVPVQL